MAITGSKFSSYACRRNAKGESWSGREKSCNPRVSGELEGIDGGTRAWPLYQGLGRWGSCFVDEQAAASAVVTMVG